MEKDHNIALIERYFNNELSTAEKETFQTQLKEDEALNAEFQRRQTAHNALDFLITTNLKKQLEELEGETKEEGETENGKVVPMKRQRSRLRILSIAASVALLVGAFYFFSLPDTTKASTIAGNYYEAPDYNDLRNVQVGTPVEDALSRGLAALQKQDYNAAIKSLDSIQGNAPFYIEAQYYQAHAYHLSGQFKKAESVFEGVSTTVDIRYKEDAEWFALLSCLAQEGSCEGKLNRMIENRDHSYYKQALSINDRISE